MKKTLLAGLLLATFSTSFMSANTGKVSDPKEEKFCCWFATSYQTQREGTCTVTYKVVTKYFLCCALWSTKTVSSKVCDVVKPNPDNGGGGNNSGGNKK